MASAGDQNADIQSLTDALTMFTNTIQEVTGIDFTSTVSTWPQSTVQPIRVGTPESDLQVQDGSQSPSR